MKPKYRVYDDDRLECVHFIHSKFTQSDGNWEHIWIEKTLYGKE